MPRWCDIAKPIEETKKAKLKADQAKQAADKENEKVVVAAAKKLEQEKIKQEAEQSKKEVEKAVLAKAAGLKDELKEKVQNINGISFIAEMVALPNAEAIKNLAYQLKDVVENLYLVLAANIDDKPLLTVMISENLVKEKGMNAGNIVRELAKEIQGGGGGQPFFATAGGKNVAGLTNALDKAKGFIK